MDHGLMGSEKGLVLVHGEVEGAEGSAIEGLRYGHAWVEDGEEVIDVSNGKHMKMPRAVYYLLGKVGKTFKYDANEAARKMVETGVYGPWDLRTESGL